MVKEAVVLPAPLQPAMRQGILSGIDYIRLIFQLVDYAINLWKWRLAF
jgi:hypothetical protein